MTRLKSKEIKEMKEGERSKKTKDLYLELMKARSNNSQVNNSKIKEIKKTIARLKTVK